MDENLPFRVTPDMPPELSGSVPRSVGLSDRSRSMPVVLTLLIGATVISWSLYGKHIVHQTQERSVLRAQGVEVQAEVTSLKRAGRGPYVVKYSFAANGQNISGLAEVPPGSLGSLPESGLIAVRYLPLNPSINHPSGWEWSPSSEWLLIVMLTGLLILCSVTTSGVYTDRKLLIWGMPATGIVTNCARSRGVYSVKYEFRTEDGELVKGSGQSLGRREAGECIWILFLPQNPRRNGPYPLSDYSVKE
jgi:hypothetical protein